MAIRSASAEWKGNLREGEGHVKLGSGAFEGSYSFRSRFGDDVAHTNPEELIGAAHAGCYSMALANILSTAGYPPTSVQTTARVHLNQKDGGFAITPIELETVAEVPNLDAAQFQQFAESAKQNCPVSKVLAGAEITLKATLK